MNKIVASKRIFSMLIFILLFNFTDLLTILNTKNSVDIAMIILILLPSSYIIYQLNQNSKEFPRYITLLAISSAVFYISYKIVDLMITVVSLVFGEQSLFNLYSYKLFIFIFILLIMLVFHFIKPEARIIYKVISGIFSFVVVVLIYFLLRIVLGSDFTISLVSYDASYTSLISIFFPFLYLSLFKFDSTYLKDSMLTSIVGYITLISIVMIASNFTAYNSSSVTLSNTAFIYFISGNSGLIPQTLIYSAYITIELIKMLVVYKLAVSCYKQSLTDENQNVILFAMILLIIEFLVVVVFANNLWTMQNVLQIIYIIISILFLISLSVYGIYICFRQYIKTIEKTILLILCSFPIIVCIFYLAYIKSPMYTIFNEIIQELNIVFYMFSILVLFFYTLETIILLYAYRKRKYTSDISADKEQKNDFTIFVLIPCMNEELVIYKTLKSLCSNQYKNLKIYVIDDASADNTLFEISKCVDIRKHVLRRCKPNAQQGKGEALNWAYYQLLKVIDDRNLNYEEVLITIIDADTEVEDDYFEKVNKVFKSDSTTTGLQSKVRVIELGSDIAQDLEFAQIINSMQSLRNLTNTVAFGGNGQFCKLSILEKLEEKPWSKSLVEDFDLSTRLFLKLGDQIHNVQYDDIYIKQSGIVKDPQALVKQRVRWAQGNVQSFKYFKQIMLSKKLKRLQKIELCSTLIKPWLMAIEYAILIYTLTLIVDVLLFEGVTPMLVLVFVLFIAMGTYILLINLIWSVSYNLENSTKLKFNKIISDAYYLTKFLFTLTQIYPQSILKHLKSDDTWDKTSRRQSTNKPHSGVT